MALVGNHGDVEPEIIDGKDARAVEKRVLIGPAQGAPNYVMRHFRINSRGYTPDHSHPWEHEVYVLKGDGFLNSEGRSIPIKSGDYVFVPAGERHQFLAGDEGIEFICVIPKYGQ